MPAIFQTAPNVPETSTCRTFVIPSSKEWLGIYNALWVVMTNKYNWEQVNATDLTVDESIELVKAMWEAYWETGSCGAGCLLPDLDTPPFRLGTNGRFEMLDPDTGEWGTPTGEYEIPPTPARTEPTADERRCAAAANAAYVLQLVYEAITDEIAMGGDTLQVAAAMVAALVTAVGGWIAAPVYAIIQLTIALFAGVVEILQVLGADVWTEDFNEKLKCALYTCSTDTGDVVTFDLECIRAELTVEPNITDPDWFYDLQLFAQVLFLLETITMDGLNAAGATTGVIDPTCSCAVEWCAEFDFTTGSHGWVVSPGYEGVVSYVAGEGWKPTNTANSGLIAVRMTFPETQHIYSTGVEINTPMTGNLKRVYYAPNGSIFTGVNSSFYFMGSSVTWGLDALPGDYDHIEVGFQNGSPNASHPKNFALERVVINGFGVNPFEEYPCA